MNKILGFLKTGGNVQKLSKRLFDAHAVKNMDIL